MIWWLNQSFGEMSDLHFPRCHKRFDQDLGLGPGAWPGIGCSFY